ncbi:MAG: phosphoenolpyruvate--protein phosphotransferase [Thermoanaerobaculia bacterium]
MPQAKRLELQGLGVSPGLAIGRAVCIESRMLEVYRFPLPKSGIGAEIERFRQAVEMAEAEIQTTRLKAHEELGDDLAAIFEAHLLMLGDSAVLGQVETRIRDEQVNAEWAVFKTAEELGERFESLESPQFRERSDDLRDVMRYLLRALQGVAHHELSELATEVVIVTHDLTPSEAVRLGRQQVVAFAIETGGLTSHTSIIARDLNIPMVAGVEGVTASVTDNDPVIIDGIDGKVILHPSKTEIKKVQRRIGELENRERELLSTRELPCVTRDGVVIDLMANIDLPEEIDDARNYGATGVGLYRSEFLYIEASPQLPSEDDHLRIYRRLIDEIHPHPVYIRTFDLGGRKLARDVMDTQEDNPVLGLRGIRLTLARPQIFKTQMRALLRAGAGRRLHVMLPMVSALDEIYDFRDFTAGVLAELEKEGLEHTHDFDLGLMIEVPSAALVADVLAREVSFFSIGTNDLIQYALAVDRNNEHVSYLYRPLHPAMLRMIRFVIDSANQAGIDCSMCGEMAADWHYTALLLGLGLRRLSLSPRVIPEIKAQIRDLTLSELTPMTERCLEMSCAKEIERYLSEFLVQSPLSSASI